MPVDSWTRPCGVIAFGIAVVGRLRVGIAVDGGLLLAKCLALMRNPETNRRFAWKLSSWENVGKRPEEWNVKAVRSSLFPAFEFRHGLPKRSIVYEKETSFETSEVPKSNQDSYTRIAYNLMLELLSIHE